MRRTSRIRRRRAGSVDGTTDAIRAVACIRFVRPRWAMWAQSLFHKVYTRSTNGGIATMHHAQTLNGRQFAHSTMAHHLPPSNESTRMMRTRAEPMNDDAPWWTRPNLTRSGHPNQTPQYPSDNPRESQNTSRAGQSCSVRRSSSLAEDVGARGQGNGLCFLAERPQARRLRRLARWLHGGGKAEAGSRCRDARSCSLQRLVRHLRVLEAHRVPASSCSR